MREVFHFLAEELEAQKVKFLGQHPPAPISKRPIWLQGPSSVSSVENRTMYCNRAWILRSFCIGWACVAALTPPPLPSAFVGFSSLGLELLRKGKEFNPFKMVFKIGKAYLFVTP